MAYAQLEKPCVCRYELRKPGDKLRKMPRDGQQQYMYGPPRVTNEAYIWPESPDRYIAAVAAETRVGKTGKNIGCYHVFPTMDAATMFVYAMAGSR